jgi:hypothetical protein
MPNRPMPKLDPTVMFISIQEHDNFPTEFTKLCEVIPSLKGFAPPDQQPPWRTLRYPIERNAEVMINLQQLGYTGMWSGIVVKSQTKEIPLYGKMQGEIMIDTRLEYAPLPEDARPSIVTAIDILKACTIWMPDTWLRPLIDLVHREKTCMIGVSCKSMEHFVQAHTWPDHPNLPKGPPPTNSCLQAVMMWLNTVPVPPELFASWLASVNNFEPAEARVFAKNFCYQTIERARAHGCDHTTP